MWASELDLFFKSKLLDFESNYSEYTDKDRAKYLSFVLSDVENIDKETEMDNFRWKFVLKAIGDTKIYWQQISQGVEFTDVEKMEIEEKAMSDSERVNHAPRFGCLAAVKSFSDPVAATKMACLSWASNNDAVIEVKGEPYCPAKWDALKRYADYFTQLIKGSE